MDIIKEKLQAELAKDAPDNALIASLTDQLLDESVDSVRFSVDAQHVQRLGFELVGKQETALSELIKNSYDADSTKVNILFENHSIPGGRITIADDGAGMNADTIKKTWMRISTSDKTLFPVSKVYGRRKAGKKGIGRFAVQRLGKTLLLETETPGEEYGVRVYFDWDGEFTAGKDLHNIWNKIEKYPKAVESKGTKLIINDLRDSWPPESIDRVWRSVLLLQPPFKITETELTKTDLLHAPDPGFNVEINGKSSQENAESASIQASFLDHALADIEGKINEDGTASFSVKSPKLNLDETEVFDTKFLLTGSLKFEAKYFIYLSDALSGVSLKKAVAMGNLYGGIRIYRDGFRVVPYGDSSNDWLKLAFDTGRRNLLVPSNNNNFFGQVHIDRIDNPLLEETSSREGLIENEAYKELINFVRACLDWATKRVASVRERKQTANQKDFTSKVRKPSEIIDQAISEIKEELDEGERGDVVGEKAEKALKEILEHTKEYEQNYERYLEDRVLYDAMLRILASLGLSISVFGHEIKGASNSVDQSVVLMQKNIEALQQEDLKQKILDNANSINKSVSKVFDLGNYVSNLMSNTETRLLKEVSIRGRVDDFISQFKDYIGKQGISFSIEHQVLGARTCKVHSSEIDSVLFNLLTNSIKALRRAKVVDRKIKIQTGIVDRFVFIRFEDNGCGVPEVDRKRIFDPFFTTTINSSLESDEIAGSGTGLGLKIVSDIASSYGGDIELAAPSDDYNTCFVFKVLSNQQSV